LTLEKDGLLASIVSMENDLSNKSEELTTLTQEKGELMVTVSSLNSNQLF
jgi:hypothetical protein